MPEEDLPPPSTTAVAGAAAVGGFIGAVVGVMAAGMMNGDDGQASARLESQQTPPALVAEVDDPG